MHLIAYTFSDFWRDFNRSSEIQFAAVTLGALAVLAIYSWLRPAKNKDGDK